MVPPVTGLLQVLMPSTPSAYPRVVCRRFAKSRVANFSIPAVQRGFCAEFVTRRRQLDGPGRDHPVAKRSAKHAPQTLYFLRLPPDFGARGLNAEAAAIFDALLVRPSRNTLGAAFAAFAPVFLPAILSPPNATGPVVTTGGAA